MGFTLAEMIVVIAIMLAMMTIILFDAPQFNQSLILNHATRGLAFEFRDAESRAVSVNVDPGSVGFVNAPDNYGIFVTSNTADADNDCVPDNEQFVLFIDRNNNRVYTPSVVSGTCGSISTCGQNTDECVKKFNFLRGIHVGPLGAQSGITIPTPPSESSVPQLSVIYKRPDPTVEIASVPGTPITNIGPYKIYIQPDGFSGLCAGECKTIQVWLTGQVSIEK